jgi:CubicO group peptidase (beta-lactamase class C family)
MSSNYRTRIVVFLLTLLFIVSLGCAQLGRRSPTVTVLLPAQTSSSSPYLSTVTVTPPAQTSSSSPYWPTVDWRTSTPLEQGMDAGKLAEMLAEIDDQNINLHGLLIIRHGYIVSENYFNFYKQDTPHDMYSVTKSFASTLIGIAIQQGFISGVDQPVLGFFPDKEFKNVDALKQAVTLDNFLSMSSGLDLSDSDALFQELYRSSDWVEFVLSRPMAAQPGARFTYCSACSHMLTAIVQATTGMDVLDFAQQELFEPLNMTSVSWEQDPHGIPIGGWGLRLTPRQMAKLGYLFLHEGTWEGRQIVSADWVRAATQEHISSGGELGYGYQWWIAPYLEGYAALGLGGQTIFVNPKLDLIVVTTAMLGGHDEIFRLIQDYILPAVTIP